MLILLGLHECTTNLFLPAHAVECRTKRILLPMFVDTSRQNACLNTKSWTKLAPEVDTSSWGERQYLTCKVHGVEAELQLGQNQTAGVNMVGKDWLSAAKVILVADYALAGCVLLKSDEALRSLIPSLPLVTA